MEISSDIVENSVSVSAVMSSIENDVTPEELEKLLLQRGFNGRSLLMVAA